MNYPYANGVLKVKEASLFTNASYLRLKDSKDILKTLEELGYERQETIEATLVNELVKTKELIDSLSPNPKLTNCFFLVSDATNIKAYYKARIFNLSTEDLYIPNSNFSKEKLEEAILNSNLEGLSKENQKLFIKIEKALEGLEENPRLISAKIDQILFDKAYKDSRRIDDYALREYLVLNIDTINIITLFRAKKLNFDLEEVLDVFIDNGKIKIDLLKDLYQEEDEEKVLKAITLVYPKLEDTLRKYFKNQSLDLLERAFKSFTLEEIAKYEYDSMKLGPMLYYYLSKEVEIENIRLIYFDQSIALTDLIKGEKNG
jgi:V/A-type H+-transporting ATPase subunit C